MKASSFEGRTRSENRIFLENICVRHCGEEAQLHTVGGEVSARNSGLRVQSLLLSLSVPVPLLSPSSSEEEDDASSSEAEDDSSFSEEELELFLPEEDDSADDDDDADEEAEEDADDDELSV